MGISEGERTLNRYIRSTFQALVEAIIPPHLKYKDYLGTAQVAGAQKLHVYEYVIWILDHSIALPVKEQLNLVNGAMSKPTAELLDLGAAHLVQTGQILYPLNVTVFPNGGPFSALSKVDRLRAITLIERLDINLENLSIPYKNNPELVRIMMDVLNELPCLATIRNGRRMEPQDYFLLNLEEWNIFHSDGSRLAIQVHHLVIGIFADS